MSDITTVRENNGTVPARSYQRRAVAPPVDVFENADELLIVADVPGVLPDGIDLQVENDTLTLHAKRPAERDASPALVREYDEADFSTTEAHGGPWYHGWHEYPTVAGYGREAAGGLLVRGP